MNMQATREGCNAPSGIIFPYSPKSGLTDSADCIIHNILEPCASVSCVTIRPRLNQDESADRTRTKIYASSNVISSRYSITNRGVECQPWIIEVIGETARETINERLLCHYSRHYIRNVLCIE